MWPTFYIPAQFVFGGQTANTDYLCGILTPGSNPTVVPTPATVGDGDTQIVLVYWDGISPTWPGIADGWRRLVDASYVPQATAINFGNNKFAAFWRVWTTGAPAFTATGTGDIFYTSIIVRNQNDDDPFFSAYLHSAINAQAGARQDGVTQYIEVAQPGDLFVGFSAPNPATSYPYLEANEPAAGDVVFACTGATAGTPGISGTVFGYEPESKHEANNLLTYSHSLSSSGWTHSGVTVTTTSYGSGPPTATIAADVGSTIHYIEQEVTLEAGKTYLLAGHFGRRTDPPFRTKFWLTYIKPDSSEHGVGRDANNLDLTGSTEVTWAGAGNPGAHQPSSEFNAAFTVLSFMISPDTTGTYKIRVYVTVDGATPTDNFAGNAGYQVYCNGLVLQEGPSVNQMPFIQETTSTPIAVGDSSYLNPPWHLLDQAAEGNRRSYGYFVLRRAGGTRPVCKLFSPANRNSFRTYSDTAILSTTRRFSSQADGKEAIGSSHCVSNNLANKKFYCELYVDSFGTGSVSRDYSIGYCLACSLQDGRAVPNPVGDHIGQYSYTSDGYVSTNGTFDAGGWTNWSAGDYIGAGLDFDNEEITFYRNGTLIETVSFSGLSELKHSLWRAQFGAFSDTTQGNQARFTYNFRGPFGGRKPSGFVAYDFDNEVT